MHHANTQQPGDLIVDTLRSSRAGLSARYIAGRSGLSESTVRTHLRELIARGLVHEAGKRGRSMRYAVAAVLRDDNVPQPTAGTASVEDARREYAAIRDRAVNSPDTDDDYTAADFDRACREQVGDTKEPVVWVLAAKAVRTRCLRCAGTGQYITGSVNGRLVGPGGECFRCRGKGHQTDADRRRNWGYDQRAGSPV